MAFAILSINQYLEVASECRRNLALFREPKVSLGQVIQRILFLVQLADREPKDDPSDTCQDGDGRIVPYEQRIGGQCCNNNSQIRNHMYARRLTNESLAKRRRERGCEQEQGHHQRAHVLWRLGKRILEPRDGRENFAKRNQHISGSTVP